MNAQEYNAEMKKRNRQHQKEANQVLDQMEANREDSNQEKHSKPLASIEKLRRCQSLTDALIDKAVSTEHKPQKPRPPEAQKDAVVLFLECQKQAESAHTKLSTATQKRTELKQLCIEASKELNKANNAFSEIRRPSDKDKERLAMVERHYQQIQLDHKEAEKEERLLKSDYEHCLIKLKNARSYFAKVESAYLLRTALIQSGLFDAISQSVLLFRQAEIEPTLSSVKQQLIESFFYALFGDKQTLPLYEQSLDFFDQKINELMTNKTL